jgi:hypothetical protein
MIGLRSLNSAAMCGAGSLIQHTGTVADIKQAGCRSWLCPTAAPGRKAELIRRLRAGRPNKFFTVTSRPDPDQTHEKRREIMGKAWPLLIRRMERHTGRHIPYLAVCEKTPSNGTPHIHAALRCRYVSQRLLSKWWEELTGWKIVDIRQVKNPKKLSIYLTKYFKKDPYKFGNSKRYWNNRDWELPPEPGAAVEEYVKREWKFSTKWVDEIEHAYRVAGYWRSPEEVVPGTRRMLWLLGAARPPPDWSDVWGHYA